MITYKLRPGFTADVPVGVLGSYLEDLKKACGGEITPELVVEKASDPDSPIHPCFTWDDSAAALAHRKQEARQLIRCYDVEVISQTSSVTISPASVRVTNAERKSVYISTSEAMSADQYRVQVLKEAGGQLKGLAERLRRLQGISPSILLTLQKLQRVIEEDIEADRKAASSKPAKPRIRVTANP